MKKATISLIAIVATFIFAALLSVIADAVKLPIIVRLLGLPLLLTSFFIAASLQKVAHERLLGSIIGSVIFSFTYALLFNWNIISFIVGYVVCLLAGDILTAVKTFFEKDPPPPDDSKHHEDWALWLQ
jgi:hypothetical protein